MSQQSISRQGSSDTGLRGLGWVALILGVATMLVGLFSRLGILPEATIPLGGLGIALFVAGYAGAILIPSLHRRIDQLEERLTLLESQSSPSNSSQSAA